MLWLESAAKAVTVDCRQHWCVLQALTLGWPNNHLHGRLHCLKFSRHSRHSVSCWSGEHSGTVSQHNSQAGIFSYLAFEQQNLHYLFRWWSFVGFHHWVNLYGCSAIHITYRFLVAILLLCKFSFSSDTYILRYISVFWGRFGNKLLNHQPAYMYCNNYCTLIALTLCGLLFLAVI